MTRPSTPDAIATEVDPTALDPLVDAIVDGLTLELRLTPKPGLIDLADSGSHPDLTLELMERSIALVAGYLRELASSVGRAEALGRQISIARAAEARMESGLGTNTHRGAIFLGGLLVLARDRAGSDAPAHLQAAVAAVARELASLAPPRGTHGETARRRYGVGGILAEARAGLPSVFDVALPAYRAARAAGADASRASFAMLASLMQSVEDTTALHRCGPAGLALLRADGARLAALVERGEHVPFLRERNAVYRELSLTMGGVADLLGVAFALLVHRGELPRTLLTSAPAGAGNRRGG